MGAFVLRPNHVSPRDAELDAAIQQQDRMIVAAYVDGSPFVGRLIAVRNDLAREQASEWCRPQPERTA